MFFVCLFLGSSIAESCHAQTFGYRDLARGADTAEIYISCHWYDNYTTSWGAIFHSTNNGQSFTFKYKYIYPDELAEIFGDSLPGALFQLSYGTGGIGISFDYGESFESKYSPLISNVVRVGGSQKGELYLTGGINIGENILYHVTHYGDSLYLNNTNMDSLRILDSGSLPGELYAFKWPFIGLFDTIRLAFSNDFGQTFTVNYIDTSIIANLYLPTLSHGTEPGELYMAAADTSNHYRILHSSDYGHTFELKHITEQFTPVWNEFSFVAGRAPGTFYIFEQGLCAGCPIHNCIKIHFSRDYGATYTTYFHELDSTYTGISETVKKLGEFKVFPNPATDKVRVQLGIRNEELGINEELRILVYDVFGREVEEIRVPAGRDEITMDVSGWPKGMYVIRLVYNNETISGKKILVQ